MHRRLTVLGAQYNLRNCILQEEDASMAEEALEAADSGGAPQDAVLRLVTAGVRPALAAALLAAPACGEDHSGAAAAPHSPPLPCTYPTSRCIIARVLPTPAPEM